MKNQYWTVVATGRTYPIKDQLQSWAFYWNAARRAWIAECVESTVLQYFMSSVSRGRWPGITLTCELEEDKFSYI